MVNNNDDWGDVHERAMHLEPDDMEEARQAGVDPDRHTPAEFLEDFRAVVEEFARIVATPAVQVECRVDGVCGSSCVGDACDALRIRCQREGRLWRNPGLPVLKVESA